MRNVIFLISLLTSSAAITAEMIPAVTSTAASSEQAYYTHLEILEPTDNFTSVTDQCGGMGCLTVKIKLTPELQTNHKLQVLVDGKPVGTAQTATSIKLEDINRGEHTLEVEVIDENNKVLINSDCVAFCMQRLRELKRCDSAS